MTSAQFIAARNRLGLSVEEMAEFLRLSDVKDRYGNSHGARNIRRYEDGSREISGPITLCID
jgi:hypothetical protein